MKKTIYHLHIPKTAGTSLRHIISSSLPQNEVYPALLWKDVYKIQQKKGNIYGRLRNSMKYSFLSGHFGYDISGLFLHNNVRRFTILREPISRSVSFYNHIISYPDISFAVFDSQGNSHQLNEPFPSLDRLLSDPIFQNLFDNIQVRYLAIDYDGFALMKKYIEEWSLVAPDYCYDFIGRQVDDSIFELAKERLSKMAFGLQEYFIVSQWIIKNKLGLDFEINSSTRLMARPKKNKVSDSAEEMIRELNRYDIELYNYAKMELLSNAQNIARGLDFDIPQSISEIEDDSEFAQRIVEAN